MVISNIWLYIVGLDIMTKKCPAVFLGVSANSPAVFLDAALGGDMIGFTG